VVCTGFIPSWTRHIIHPIHKSGNSFDPNNYWTIMVGHTSKLYATVLHHWLFEELESRHIRARGQASFYPNYQMIDHIFTLRAIIEEARHRTSKVYNFFVDFQKAFDTIPREALFQRLRDIDIFETLLATIMRLYKSILGRLRMAHNLFNFIQSNHGGKTRVPPLPNHIRDLY
jgi:hypothetical protein